MKGVARLERHDILTPGLGQDVARLGGSSPQILKIVMARHLQHSDWAGSIQATPSRHLMDKRMLGVLRAQHSFGQVCRIPGI
jgi:hypothetical protein